ncbi:MAG: hypothetical protein ACM3S2_10060 [Ignavibacteriales bacterium]
MAVNIYSSIPAMESLNYRRINWQIELLNLLLIGSEAAFAYQNDIFPRLLPGLIIQVCAYALLSLIYYFVLGPKVLFPKTGTVVPVELRDISEQESLRYIKRGVICFNSTKLIISFIIITAMLMNIYHFNSYYSLILMIILLSILLYLILQFTKNTVSARGYVLTSNKELLKNFVFYFNPDDRRTSVDKPLGMGSTINLATKDGKMIMGVILAIPISLIIMLLIALALAGKL